MNNTHLRRVAKPFTRTLFRSKYLINMIYKSNYRWINYNPIGVYWLSPNSVSKMMIPGEELSREYTPGVVVGGEWDRKTKPFTDSIYYESFKFRFIDGVPWKETPLYESALNRDPENYWHGCATEAEVKAKLSEYTDVYRSIEENGYLTQRELQSRGMMTQTLVPPEKNEVRINIDRDGNVIFEEGRHRFSIAKILGLEQIPVVVMGRHKRWVENGGTLDDIESLFLQK